MQRLGQEEEREEKLSRHKHFSSYRGGLTLLQKFFLINVKVKEIYMINLTFSRSYFSLLYGCCCCETGVGGGWQRRETPLRAFPILSFLHKQMPGNVKSLICITMSLVSNFLCTDALLSIPAYLKSKFNFSRVLW